MTDWSKLKVADLKDELKARGIPLTGLKLKQQYVDKLQELEAENGAQSGPEHDANEAEDPSAEDRTETHSTAEDKEPHDEAVPASNDAEQGLSKADGAGIEKPQELEAEDSHAEEVVENTEQRPEPQERPSVDESQMDVNLAPESEGSGEQVEATKKESVGEQEIKPQSDAGVDERPAGDSAPVPEQSTPGERPDLQPSSAQPIQPPSSSPPVSEIADEERKRRKRSATPVPSEEEVARKKARLSMDGETLTGEQVSALEHMKAETEIAKEIRGEPTNGATATEVIVEQPGEDMSVTTEPVQQRHDNRPEDPKEQNRQLSASPRRSRSPSEERDVPPAIHPATSTLYIRNFKRPLHIPSLRSHIASLAKPRSSADDDPEPVTLFYLDNIRTHAFVSFNSVAAASRVRTAMHDTRYPNESMREPLFVDFVPDDKVQSWIDQETGGGFGGRGGGGRRFEVAYERRDDGVEAVFQELDTNKPLPPSQPRLSSRMSMSTYRPGPESLPTGVHPDRAVLVPRASGRDRENDHVRQPPSGPKNAESTSRGFKALDELFQFTTAKPKLYYKPVPESVAEERLDMFRDLRVGFASLGRSGDEGMKRYSFEQYKGGEEWVDKGPEFGFGRRGQDRLVGARGRGGYRGRGDSWRGRGAR